LAAQRQPGRSQRTRSAMEIVIADADYLYPKDGFLHYPVRKQQRIEEER
jgi:hypothetical protein